jgi:hypothetical protein
MNFHLFSMKFPLISADFSPVRPPWDPAPARPAPFDAGLSGTGITNLGNYIKNERQSACFFRLFLYREHMVLSRFLGSGGDFESAKWCF